MRCRDAKGKCHFVHYEIELQSGCFFFPRKQLFETRNSMRLCAGLATHTNVNRNQSLPVTSDILRWRWDALCVGLATNIPSCVLAG